MTSFIFQRHVENAAVVQKKVEPEEDPSTEKNTEGLPCTAVFVNTRRGKGRNAKRKISNDKCDAKSTTNAVEVCNYSQTVWVKVGLQRTLKFI